MALLSRFTRMVKADIHGVMDQLEDKSLILAQCLREMEEDLLQTRARLETCRRAATQTQKRIAKCGEKLGSLNRDLDAAIEKERDDIARFLIRQVHAAKKLEERLRDDLAGAEKQIQDLGRSLEQKTLSHEDLKQRIGRMKVMDQRNRDLATACPGGSSGAWDEMDEAQVELELLKRKEALSLGGTP